MLAPASHRPLLRLLPASSRPLFTLLPDTCFPAQAHAPAAGAALAQLESGGGRSGTLADLHAFHALAEAVAGRTRSRYHAALFMRLAAHADGSLVDARRAEGWSRPGSTEAGRLLLRLRDVAGFDGGEEEDVAAAAATAASAAVATARKQRHAGHGPQHAAAEVAQLKLWGDATEAAEALGSAGALGACCCVRACVLRGFILSLWAARVRPGGSGQDKGARRRVADAPLLLLPRPPQLWWHHPYLTVLTLHNPWAPRLLRATRLAAASLAALFLCAFFYALLKGGDARRTAALPAELSLTDQVRRAPGAHSLSHTRRHPPLSRPLLRSSSRRSRAPSRRPSTRRSARAWQARAARTSATATHSSGRRSGGGALPRGASCRACRSSRRRSVRRSCPWRRQRRSQRLRRPQSPLPPPPPSHHLAPLSGLLQRAAAARGRQHLQRRQQLPRQQQQQRCRPLRLLRRHILRAEPPKLHSRGCGPQTPAAPGVVWG